MNKDLNDRLAHIELVGFDIDGVFTDGRLYVSDDGNETKAFHTQDGYGIRRLLDSGVVVAIISGRKSRAVERRMKELGVRHVALGVKDKGRVFRNLLTELGIEPEASAFVGDDLPDLAVMRESGMAIGVANAHPDLHEHCDWITEYSGGFGAVREVCDEILAAKNTVRRH